MKMVLLAQKTAPEEDLSRDLESGTSQNFSIECSSTSPGYILTSPGNLINANVSAATNITEAVLDAGAGAGTGLDKSIVSSENYIISNTSETAEKNEIPTFCSMSDDLLLEIVDDNLQLLREVAERPFEIEDYTYESNLIQENQVSLPRVPASNTNEYPEAGCSYINDHYQAQIQEKSQNELVNQWESQGEETSDGEENDIELEENIEGGKGMKGTRMQEEDELINQLESSREETSDDGEDVRQLEENDTEGGEMEGSENLSNRELTKINVRTRSKIRNSSNTWEQKVNQKRREKGVSYKGKKKQTEGWLYDRPRPGRFLADPCHCKRGNKERSKLKCSIIAEERRRKIFSTFWNKMTWPEKKMYVKGLVKVEKVKRRRGNNEISRRNFSITYTLKDGLDNVLVCKSMFVGTLGLKGRTVVEWVKEDLENVERTEIVEGPAINRKSLVRQAKNESLNTGLIKFFDELAKMESHYCRATSKKIYLEPLWTSKLSLYRFYKSDYCIQNELQPVSIAKFHTTFDNLNMSLFHPKKDECDVCVGYRTSNISAEKYKLHQILKEEARAQKSEDKLSNDAVVLCVDLQSVLLSPKTNVSSMYYKTKLIVHNYTIYNLKTKEAYCYLWNEAEGQLTSNEFSSILVYFLETEIIPKLDSVRKIIIYSDGCTGQNRNITLSNALLQVSFLHKVIIIQKYLLKGHTQMEVDSVHSTIERKVRNLKINLPADYIEVCKKARHNPFPYNVKYLTHDFFKNFSSLRYYNSLRPGRTVGDPMVVDIKSLKYENGSIQFKLRHTAELWSDLPRRIMKNISSEIRFDSLPRLYEGRLKIKADKYQHLMVLIKGINQEYHDFYINLPHQ